MAKKTLTAQQIVSMIEEQKAIAKAAYEKADQLAEMLLKKYGHGHEMTNEIVDPETQTSLWKRVRIFDNAELLKEGKPLFKSTVFKRIEIEIDYLKKKPEPKNQG